MDSDMQAAKRARDEQHSRALQKAAREKAAKKKRQADNRRFLEELKKK